MIHQPDEDIVDVNNLQIDANSTPRKKLNDDFICRICLEREIPEDPFISPCKCAGSMKYIHLSCLQKQ